MKYQLKALHMSLALHVVIIALLVMMNNAFPRADNMIVIDFTMDDAAGSAVLMNKPAGIMHSPAYKQQKAAREETEITRQGSIAQPKPEPLPPVYPEKQQITRPAILTPSSMPGEKVAVTEKRDKTDEADRNAFSAGSHKAIFSNETAGKGTVTGTGENAGVHNYLKAHFAYITDIINQHIAYPLFARKMGWAGKGKISFIITATGDVRDIRVIESTGREILDRNAREAVKNSSPFPRPPVEAKIIVPVLYRLR